jgi:hypothetical protein
MPRHAIYQQNREEFRKAESARRIGKQVLVIEVELERLRQAANRQEALAYGIGKRCVCLWCGLICDNLSRHVSACPKKPQQDSDTDAYRDYWQYLRTEPLRSPANRLAAVEVRKNSKAFQQYIKSEANRTHLEKVRSEGASVKRGTMRPLHLARRTAAQKGRPRRLRKPGITDAQIEKILALDLPIAEAARRAGLSKTAFYRRAQRRHGWTGADVKARRSLVTRYIFDLRQWLRSQQETPRVQDVIARHTAGLRSKSAERFQQFRPFFPHLEAELNAHPEWLKELATVKLGSAAIVLASKIFQRARNRKRRGAPKKSKPEHVIFGQTVTQVLPRFRKGFDLLKGAKAENPSNSQKWTAALRTAQFSDQEISAMLASRKPEAAAVRWVSSNGGKTLKTGKNLLRLFRRSQSPEE